MIKRTLVFNENCVTEMAALSRIYIGKDNSLGIRIAPQAKEFNVINEDGEKVIRKFTPVALYTFQDGEVEIRNVFAEELEQYPETGEEVSVSSKDFFTAVSAFANIAGGVSMEIDQELKVLWMVSLDGGVRLRVAIRQPLAFSKARATDGVRLRVGGEEFRRAVGSVSGLNCGMMFDGKQLIVYGGNASSTQYVKSVVDPSIASGVGKRKDKDLTIELAIPSQAMIKISQFFKGNTMDILMTETKLIIQDSKSWYETPVLASPRVNGKLISVVEKMAEAPICTCLLQAEVFNQALVSMRAATAIMKAKSSDDVYLYITATANDVALTLVDGSQVVFSPLKCGVKEETEFRVAMSQDLLEKTITKLGSMAYLAIGFNYTPDRAGCLLMMQPVTITDNKVNTEAKVTAYCVSIGYAEAFKKRE